MAFGTYSGLRSEPTEYSFEDIKKALDRLEHNVTQPVAPALVHLHSPEQVIEVKKSKLLSRTLKDEPSYGNLVQTFEFDYK